MSWLENRNQVFSECQTVHAQEGHFGVSCVDCELVDHADIILVTMCSVLPYVYMYKVMGMKKQTL